MSARSVLCLKTTVLSVAALLLLGPQLLAGGSMRAARPAVTYPQPAAAYVPVRWAPQGGSVAVTVAVPAQPAAHPSPGFAVNLRGPDGQVRRFAVEGGRDVIRVRSVILRPGESLTIQWRPAK